MEKGSGSLAAWIVAIFFCTSLVYISWREMQAITFFSNALANVGAQENILVNGKTYGIEAGVVYDTNGNLVTGLPAFAPLRLAYALELARRSPLFSIEGTA